jgi:hypothetical protein
VLVDGGCLGRARFYTAHDGMQYDEAQQLTCLLSDSGSVRQVESIGLHARLTDLAATTTERWLRECGASGTVIFALRAVSSTDQMTDQPGGE